MKKPIFFLLVICLSAGTAQAGNLQSKSSSERLLEQNGDFFSANLRLLEQKQRAQHLWNQEFAESCRRRSPADPAVINLEADYILSTQFLESGNPASGALNNVYGAPTWVVPRENALAILALIQSSKLNGNAGDLQRAQQAADYLVRVQDVDGGWFDQYSYADPYLLSKSPTQTAEVMMAFDKLGYGAARYASMKKGAEFLMLLQDPANKGGIDDGLISGGKKDDGTFQTWRWTSDNSFAYLALKAAEHWAARKGDTAFAKKAGKAANRVLSGINNYLYVSNPSDPDFGVWRRVIDENGTPVDPTYHEWINYAPQMLDLPAKGVGKKIVGEWIHNTFQKADGSVVWDDRWFADRKSPGFSFQASLVWLDLGQKQYADAAVNWAKNSGLWQTTPDANGISGGWIDWTQGSETAPWWQRFIDTSFYFISVLNGGYDFRS